MRQALFVLFFAGAACLQGADRPAAKPNIVFIPAERSGPA